MSHRNNNVTLLLEKQHKEFTSDKLICPLQFGTIIHIIGLSLTFKTIKQKIQVFQLSELISFLFWCKVRRFENLRFRSSFLLPKCSQNNIQIMATYIPKLKWAWQA